MAYRAATSVIHARAVPNAAKFQDTLVSETLTLWTSEGLYKGSCIWALWAGEPGRCPYRVLVVNLVVHSTHALDTRPELSLSFAPPRPPHADFSWVQLSSVELS